MTDKWTRADLPDSEESRWDTFRSRFGAFDGYRSESHQHSLYTVFKSGMQYAEQRVLEHLNAHHPKPDETGDRHVDQ